MVIFRPDGYPTYNFAVVVDDWDMGITEVIAATTTSTTPAPDQPVRRHWCAGARSSATCR